MSSGISMSPVTHSDGQTQDQEAITRNAGPSDNIRSTEDDLSSVPLSALLWMGPRTDMDQPGFYTHRTRGSHTAAAGLVTMHAPTIEDAEVGVQDNEPVLNRATIQTSSSNGSGAGEYLISIVTFVGIMFVIFKTVSVIIPWWTKATIWCMLSGWISLQALLIVSQRGYDINSDTASVLRTAIAVETKITGPVARVSTIFLTLPLLGYLSVVTSWQTVEMPDGTFDWVLGFFCSFPYVLGFLGLFSHDSKIRAFISLAWIPLLVDELQENCFTILITLMSASLGGTLAGLGIWRLYLFYHACKELVESSDVQSATSDSLDTSSAAAFCIYHVIFALLIFPFYTLWFFVPMKHPGTEPSIPRVPILVYNLAATLLMFVCTMLQYNPDGTYKPEWLDWLGRTLKTGQASAGL
ncbi:hypothetical protein E8E14_011454 [Neopestalotiopsis sp. 37M]|nr:hypothetical protein E8E14_011454 [Neopestalotiopsis sp. 37M]